MTVLPLLPLLLAASTPINPELQRAESLFAELQYADCAVALDAAWARRGTDRTAVLRILELEGTVAALLSQPEKAKLALRRLFLLSPDRKIDADLSPRLRLPMYEAKAWATEKGAMRLSSLPPDARAGALERLAVRLSGDPLAMARKVRFHLLGPGGWSAADAPLSQLSAQVPVEGAQLRWWAEALDERERVLLTLGSEEEPQLARADAPLAAAPGLDATAPAPAAGPRYRPLAYTALGLAAVAAGGGVYFGTQSAATRERLERPAVDEDGRVTSLRQADVAALNQAMKRDALVADVLLVSTAALAITGVTVWIAGTPAKVTPAPGGVAISGALP